MFGIKLNKSFYSNILKYYDTYLKDNEIYNFVMDTKNNKFIQSFLEYSSLGPKKSTTPLK